MAVPLSRGCPDPGCLRVCSLSSTGAALLTSLLTYQVSAFMLRANQTVPLLLKHVPCQGLIHDFSECLAGPTSSCELGVPELEVEPSGGCGAAMPAGGGEQAERRSSTAPGPAW